MKHIFFLATAAALVLACHNRNEDETAVTPSSGDTTAAVHAIDSTRTGPPGVAGRPGDATVTPDSVGVDTTGMRRDTTSSPTPSSTPQDTVGPR
jgi:hypothetical protein